MARTFTDSSGQQWTVSLSISVARRLLASADAIDLLDPKRLAAAIDNPYDRFAILWSACESQARERGITTAEEFDGQLVPKHASPQEQERVWADAETALREALQDFFLRIGQNAQATVMTRTIAARRRLDGVASEKLNSDRATRLIEDAALQASDEIDAAFDAAIDQLRSRGTPSTN